MRPICRGQGSEPGAVNTSEARPNQCVDKCPDVISGFLGYAVIVTAGIRNETVFHGLPIKELPQIDARRVQAIATTGIGVKENGPVIKFLPEDDERIPYGSVSVVHGSASRFPTVIAHTEAHLLEDIQRFMQLECQGTPTARKSRGNRIYRRSRRNLSSGIFQNLYLKKIVGCTYKNGSQEQGDSALPLEICNRNLFVEHGYDGLCDLFFRQRFHDVGFDVRCSSRLFMREVA